MAERIGFIGVGIMGRPMVKNLVKAGYPVTIFDVVRASVEALENEGVPAAVSSKEVAEKSDVVITMLPEDPHVEAAILGETGVFAGARPGQLVIDMSTISPVVSRKIAEEGKQRKLRVLDAPVSGGDKGAIAGTLSIMVGGDAADFEAAKKIFEAMGKTIIHCGPHGAGQVVKACNQIVVALTIEAVCEALVLGSKAGVQPDIILEVLGGGLAGNKVMEVRGPNFLNHDFAPGFKIKLHRKDLGIVLSTAQEYGVALPVTALVNQMFTTLVNEGQAELDHSALLTHLEKLSQHVIGTTEEA
ncbi:MAG: 2-hydroxy-3-oxopropionate reductase [Thermoanaerobaculales bacterium]|nr:2-hydroxy-3-oxopropionate reductase [Thermoanaerobaculales bacterium]